MKDNKPPIDESYTYVPPSETDDGGSNLGRAGRALGVLLVPVCLSPALTPNALASDNDQVTQEVVSESAGYNYKLLSSPDFLNGDLGNTRKSPLWKPGDPISTNKRYDKALGVVLDAFKREGVTDVAVAGDLVNGHWGKDTAGTGIFGPTDTFKQKRVAVKRAAKLYYKQWDDRFDDHGLRPLAALGDHEIGDNPWRRGQGGGSSAEYSSFKQRTIPLWKDLFGKYILQDNKGRRLFPEHPNGPAANTAYSVRLHPEVELITLDVFKQTKNDVIAEVDPKQMKWLKGRFEQLNKEGVDWKIVQFHTPILGPVRQVGSSGLMYEGGKSSKLWKVLKNYDADLILNGEVHDITAHQPRTGDPVQISHGGIFQYGLTNYLVIDINNDTMSITAKDFKNEVGPKRSLWQTDTGISAPAWVKYSRESHRVGSLVLTSDGVITERTGMLDVYKGKK